ncbi:NfrA family protein [Halopseudomonas salegens]|nr:phage receptor [Halopseudomonas salegens]
MTGSPLTAASDLSNFQQYLSHPYMHRAYQAVEQNDWPEVQRLTEYLVGRVPEHEEARWLLVESLLRQEQIDSALIELQGLPVSERRLETEVELKIRLVVRGRVDQPELLAWLAEADDSAHVRLWQARNQYIQRAEGNQAALQWLASAPLRDGQALRMWRAVLAEQVEDHQQVISDLYPLLVAEQLDEEQWQRLGMALLAVVDFEAATELLEMAPNRAVRHEFVDMLIDRAIAVRRHEVALHWLSQRQQLTDSESQVLWELARVEENVDLVVTLAETHEQDCFDTVEWLSVRAVDQARQVFLRCRAQEHPQRWLVLGLALQLHETMASRPLTGQWEGIRQEELVRHWLAADQSSQALTWLQNQPVVNGTRERRALLQQQLGLLDQALVSWLAIYRRQATSQALEQASWLMVEAGDREEALALLLDAFENQRQSMSEASLGRLGELLAQHPGPLPDIQMLLPQLPLTSRLLLLDRLADSGRCDEVIPHISKVQRQPAEWRLLGQCAHPGRPGAAVVYLRKAVNGGDALAKRALAYALFEAGDADEAWRLWLQLSPSLNAPEEYMAMLRSGLAAGNILQAEHKWQQLALNAEVEYWRLGAALALSAGEYQLALERDRRALSLQESAEGLHAAAASALAAGEDRQALIWLQRSRELAPDQPAYLLEHAYLLARQAEHQERARAIPLLQRAVEFYPEDFMLQQTLAQLLNEQSEPTLARASLRQAIDLVEPELWVADQDGSELAQRKYELRRSHESLSRRNSFTVASSWSPFSVASAGQPLRGENYQLVLWDHALGEEPVNNGRTLSVYGRALTAAGRRDSYFETAGLGVGIRSKPLSNQNLNLYAELYNESGLRGQGGRGFDLLLRATASLFDQGDYRNDWRPAEQGWHERSLYLDAAWFVDAGELQLLGRFQQGYNYKLANDSPQTLMPYGFVQGVMDGKDEDLRIGAGLRWQYWFDDDRYNAWRGRFAVRAEYHQGLSGSLYDRRGGWLLGMEVNW